MTAPINGVIGRKEDNDLRWYIDPASPEVVHPSVTTVLGATHDMSYILTPWAGRSAAQFAVENMRAVVEKMGNEGHEAAWKWVAGEAERIRNLKREIGTHQHNILEALILDAPIPDCPEHLIDIEIDGESVDQDAISDGLVNFLNDYDPVIEMAEATVANPEVGYAGTLDAAGWFPSIRIPGRERKGARLVIDLKTGKYMGETAKAQIISYKNATEVWVDDLGNKAPMPTVDMAGILHLRRHYKGGYKLYLVEPHDEPSHWIEFLQALALFGRAEMNKKLPMAVFYPPLGDGSQPLPMIEDITADGFGRCRKPLIAAGIVKLDDLLGLTADEVQSIKGVGPKAIEACRAVLRKYDLEFAGEAVA